MLLDKERDLIVVIDMINGFAYEGAFASDNVAKIVAPMKEFLAENIKNGVEVIHYTDSHPQDSQEFKTYPVHCIENTNEAKVIKELDFEEIEIIKKNSTNGFHVKNPFDYKKNIYLIGCVTDICIFEFALTSQKYKEEFNLPYQINIIKDLVTTFDGPKHNSKNINDEYLSLLSNQGIVIKNL